MGEKDGALIVEKNTAGAFAIANGASMVGKFAAGAVAVVKDALPFARSVISVASAAQIHLPSAIKKKSWGDGQGFFGDRSKLKRFVDLFEMKERESFGIFS